MTSMTFESISHSPRRAAVRRTQRAVPTPVPAPAVAHPQQVATVRALGSVKKTRSSGGWILAVGLTVALHAIVLTVVNKPMQVAPMPRKLPELAMEIAPPPPPPPVELPKPLPKVVAVKPAPAPKPLPSTPVVQNVTPTDTPSADTVQVATAPPPPPAPVAAAPEPEPVTEPRGYAGYLNNPAPSYPAAAQKRGLQGRVILKIHVLASGQADNVSVAKSSGYDILDDAAIKAVSGWVFDPAKRGQKPIDGWVNVPINFKIS